MILIISTCSDRLNEFEFVQPIVNIVNKEWKIKHYSKVSKNDISVADKVIICGTSLKDNRFLEDLKLFEWLKNFDKPVLGICAGMQIIGLNFGAKLVLKKEIGMIKVEMKKENILFDNDFEVYCLHGNSLSNLKQFEILAKSETSVQVIKKDNIYGILFHPEVRNENIVKNFIAIC